MEAATQDTRSARRLLPATPLEKYTMGEACINVPTAANEAPQELADAGQSCPVFGPNPAKSAHDELSRLGVTQCSARGLGLKSKMGKHCPGNFQFRKTIKTTTGDSVSEASDWDVHRSRRHRATRWSSRCYSRASSATPKVRHRSFPFPFPFHSSFSFSLSLSVLCRLRSRSRPFCMIDNASISAAFARANFCQQPSKRGG